MESRDITQTLMILRDLMNHADTRRDGEALSGGLKAFLSYYRSIPNNLMVTI